MEANSELNETGFSPKMALCLAAITIVGIDGEFKEDELNKLRNLIKEDETAFLKAFNFYNDHPLEVCIKIVAMRLNDEQKRCTCQILYNLAYADKEIVDSEKKLLDQYVKAFRLNEKYATSLKKSVSREFDLKSFE